MNRVDRIEREVGELSPDELARFRAWFETYDAEQFDRRIEDDAGKGRLDALAAAALADHRAGKTRPL